MSYKHLTLQGRYLINAYKSAKTHRYGSIDTGQALNVEAWQSDSFNFERWEKMLCL